jgi:hypothetical protein
MGLTKSSNPFAQEAICVSGIHSEACIIVQQSNHDRIADDLIKSSRGFHSLFKIRGGLLTGQICASDARSYDVCVHGTSSLVQTDAISLRD